ncbi:hypothetical protein SARC_13650, partial [Sphaeroforma arctica JP610]
MASGNDANDVCLHAMFREQVARTPDNIALISKDRSITYKALDEASDRLAASLIRHGVKKDSCVGILMDRSLEYALTYVAILKAGGAYLVLDPAYPEDLLANVLKSSKPTVVVCKRNLAGRLPETSPVIVLKTNPFDAKNSVDQITEE